MINIVICTKDRPGLLSICLSGLLNQDAANFDVSIFDFGESSALFSFEVVKVMELCNLMDINISYNQCSKLSERCFTYHRYYSTEAVKEREGDYILTLDDDIFLESDYFMKLLHVMKVEKAGFVVGNIVEVDNYRKFKDFTRKELTFDGEFKYGMYKDDCAVKIKWSVDGATLFSKQKFFESGGYTDLKELPGGADIVITKILAKKYGGYMRTGAKAWHLSDLSKEKGYKGEFVEIIYGK